MTRGERGFSLLELVLALFLLGTVLLSVAPMFMSAARRNAGGADLGRVGALAVDRMEALRATRLSSLIPGGSLVSNTSAGGVDYFDVSDSDVIVRWQITNGATPSGGRRVQVRAVSVRQISGEPKEITLDSVRGTN